MARTTVTASLRRAALRFALASNWAPITESPLPNGRRADILALTPKSDFVIIEVKSCVADFTADRKWPDYLDYCDSLYFAVDSCFPMDLLPTTTGLLVCAAEEAARLRDAQRNPLPPARRNALLRRFARLAAIRCAAIEDPAGFAAARAGIGPE